MFWFQHKDFPNVMAMMNICLVVDSAYKPVIQIIQQRLRFAGCIAFFVFNKRTGCAGPYRPMIFSSFLFITMVIMCVCVCVCKYSPFPVSDLSLSQQNYLGKVFVIV